MATANPAPVSLRLLQHSVVSIKGALERLQRDVEALEQALTALGATAPAKTSPTQTRAAGHPVELAGPRGAHAQALFAQDGVWVLRGSRMAATMVPSMPPALRAVRQQLLDGAVVRRVGKKLTFAQDHFFPSVSTAAAVVMGRNANGWLEWRNPDGRPLKELRQP